MSDVYKDDILFVEPSDVQHDLAKAAEGVAASGVPQVLLHAQIVMEERFEPFIASVCHMPSVHRVGVHYYSVSGGGKVIYRDMLRRVQALQSAGHKLDWFSYADGCEEFEKQFSGHDPEVYRRWIEAYITAVRGAQLTAASGFVPPLTNSFGAVDMRQENYRDPLAVIEFVDARIDTLRKFRDLDQWHYPIRLEIAWLGPYHAGRGTPQEDWPEWLWRRIVERVRASGFPATWKLSTEYLARPGVGVAAMGEGAE